MKKTLLAVIAASMMSPAFAGTELIDRISFNQLEKYNGYYHPGGEWDSIVDSVMDVRPWKQKWNIANSPYTYTESEEGYIVLELDWQHRNKIVADKLYKFKVTAWEFNKDSRLESKFTVLDLKTRSTLFEHKDFGKKEYLEFTILGKDIDDGLMIKNPNLAIDEIHLYEIDESKTDIIDFEHLAGRKHGNTHKDFIESKGIAFTPKNQKSGTKNERTFTYGDSSAHYRIYPTDPSLIDPEAHYRLEVVATSSTSQSKNKDKVKLYLKTRTRSVDSFNLFGTGWVQYGFNFTGEELLDSLYLHNSFVAFDDLSIRKIEKSELKNSLMVSTDDSEGGNSTYNGVKAMEEVALKTGYSVNHYNMISEKRFVQELDKAVSETANGGVLYSVFSGHMSTKGDYSLSDMQISAKEIKARLDKFKGLKVVIFDNCGSENALLKFKNDPNYIVMASSKINQFSFGENYAYYMQGSQFAEDNMRKEGSKIYVSNMSYYLAEGADVFYGQTLPADTNGDNIITFKEAFDYAAPRAEAASKDGGRYFQTPVMYAPKEHQHYPLMDFNKK